MVKKILIISFVMMFGMGLGRTASADVGLGYFLNNFREPNEETVTTFNLVCFQNGEKIINEKELVVRKVEGEISVGHRFQTLDGKRVAVFIPEVSGTVFKVKETGVIIFEKKKKPIIGKIKKIN